jgi:phosphate transport system substrate-binding protein
MTRAVRAAGAWVIVVVAAACKPSSSGSSSSAAPPSATNGGPTSVPAIGAAGSGTAGGSATLTVAGSSALFPLAQAAAQAYQAQHPGVVINVAAGGSGQGLAQVEAGAVDIGDSDIPAATTMGDLVDHRVAIVVFAIVANRGSFDDAVGGLTHDQAVGVFSGKLVNWKDLGGGDEPITVLNRPEGSGTRKVFTQIVMGGAPLIAGTPVEDNSDNIKKSLTEVPGSVSYLATAYVDNTVKALSYDGANPDAASVTAGHYPIYSFEHMYTKGEASGTAREFVDFMLSADVQGSIIAKAGYLPVSALAGGPASASAPTATAPNAAAPGPGQR